MSWISVVAGIFVAIGAVMLFASQRQFTRRRTFLQNSATTSGVVIALTENREREEISYSPKVKFQTSTGREITFQSEMGSSSGAKRIGDSVTVRYSVEQPHSAEIDEFMPLWGPALLFGILGIVFLFVGVGILTDVLPV